MASMAQHGEKDLQEPIITINADRDSSDGISTVEQPAHSPLPTDLNRSFANIADSALTFLSTASNETLGACLVGLGATTYVVLGRVGLVLIGVVGGIALHAAWEGKNGNTESTSVEERRRKEVGLNIIHRILEWSPSRGAETREEGPAVTQLVNDNAVGFSDYRPETGDALQALSDAVVRDYVKWWYSPILPTEPTFPAACTRTFNAFVRRFSSHIARKRPSDVFLHFATNSSATMAVFLNEISAALSATPNIATKDAIDSYLRSKPDSNLANLTRRRTQELKLNVVAEDILERYLESSAYLCSPVRVFLQQILAKLVLDTTMTSCSKPEFINGWIVYLLQEGEPEIMKEIDAGVEGLAAGSPSTISVPKIEDDSEVKHERVKSQAQDTMDETMQEVKRLSQMIADHDAGNKEVHGRDVLMRENLDSAGPSSPHPEKTASPAHSTLTADDASDFTTQGVNTPMSSSQDDIADADPSVSHRTSSEAAVLPPPHEVDPISTGTFTSFDQLPPEFSTRSEDPAELVPLTLHNAKISIFDGSDPNSRQAIKTKPNMEYMVQIEPASASHSGWMIIRRYADFENLHEVLGRIAKVSGAAVFTQAHPALPGWKGNTEARLREDLERYLLDAVRFPSLAESGGLKLFLEKEQATSKVTGQKSGFGWPTPAAFENMGKGMVDALTKAPKEVAGGGKAFIGGVTGVLGSKQKRQSVVTPSKTATAAKSAPITTTSPRNSGSDLSTSAIAARKSHDDQSVLTTPAVDQLTATAEPSAQPVSALSETPQPNEPVGLSQNTLEADELLSLPPPPSDMPDDYQYHSTNPPPKPPRPLNPGPAPKQTPVPDVQRSPAHLEPSKSRDVANVPDKKPAVEPLSTEETRVAVELMFATITELYTLSSAWSLRRTLLNTAKTFLLRPGSPQLLSIQNLLQESVLDLSTSDGFIAQQIRTLRANALPTEEELAAWPKPPTEEEKDELRVKARKLLCERGMPVALTGVMGQQASAEALGRVFDALQIEDVARGMVFGIMLQALRGIIQ